MMLKGSMLDRTKELSRNLRKQLSGKISAVYLFFPISTSIFPEMVCRKSLHHASMILLSKPTTVKIIIIILCSILLFFILITLLKYFGDWALALLIIHKLQFRLISYWLKGKFSHKDKFNFSC